jgi:hypothetical protein
MPEAKDILIGILGASGALAGLLLVFGGFIFAQAASFPASTADKITERYTKAGKLAILPFWGFLITTLTSVFWLLFPSHCLLIFTVILFCLLVIGTGIYGTVMSYRYL